MMNRRCCLFFLFVPIGLFGHATPGLSQGSVIAAPVTPSAREELLALVPADPGFCLIVQNLREQAQKWRTAPWLKTFQVSPLGQSILSGPEFKKLSKVDDDLRKHLQIDFAGLRDDIFGDAMVLAYWPGPPPAPEKEEGLLLVRPRNAELLGRLVQRLNEGQMKSGELKEVTELEHKGVKYQRRVDLRSTHFVLVHEKEKLFAFTGQEGVLRRVIEAKLAGAAPPRSPIAQHVSRAGAERGFAALWINPRAFTPQLEEQAKQAKGPEAYLLRSFLSYWRPMDALVFSLADADDLEIRIAMQARVKELPASIRGAFDEPVRATELWGRFPPSAIASVGGQADIGRIGASIGEFLPPESRKLTLDALQKVLRSAIGLNLVKDVLPNVGPDWGLFVVATPDNKRFPHVVAALSARPGAGEVPVDRGLYNAIRNWAAVYMVSHNFKNPRKQIHLKTMQQNDVEVCYLTGDQVFARGLQPAWAVKDGYLVFATSPDAVRLFQRQADSPPISKGEAPIIKLSPFELAKLLRARRPEIVNQLADANKVSVPAANELFDSTMGVLELFDSVVMAQASGNGQVIWTTRLRPRIVP